MINIKANSFSKFTVKTSFSEKPDFLKVFTESILLNFIHTPDRYTVSTSLDSYKEYFVGNTQTLLSFPIIGATLSKKNNFFENFLGIYFYSRENIEEDCSTKITDYKIDATLAIGSRPIKIESKNFEFLIIEDKIFLNLLFDNIDLPFTPKL